MYKACVCVCVCYVCLCMFALCGWGTSQTLDSPSDIMWPQKDTHTQDREAAVEAVWSSQAGIPCSHFYLPFLSSLTSPALDPSFCSFVCYPLICLFYILSDLWSNVCCSISSVSSVSSLTHTIGWQETTLATANVPLQTPNPPLLLTRSNPRSIQRTCSWKQKSESLKYEPNPFTSNNKIVFESHHVT